MKVVMGTEIDYRLLDLDDAGGIVMIAYKPFIIKKKLSLSHDTV